VVAADLRSDFRQLEKESRRRKRKLHAVKILKAINRKGNGVLANIFFWFNAVKMKLAG
jgi:hypothetical protein